MGANNKYGSKDRHEYNNKLTGINSSNNNGIGLFITLIMVILGILFYGIYKAYQNYKIQKENECKNVKMKEWQEDKNVGYT